LEIIHVLQGHHQVLDLGGNLMDEKVLYVCFTMDVERIKSLSPTGGPPDWGFSERSVRSYCDILIKNGYPVTLFIVPDAATEQRSLFRALSKEGHECGMHFHNQSWRDHWKTPESYDYLGGYTGDEQKALLSESLSQTADALSFAPLAFRPGNFSANDESFKAIVGAGFTHGSVSQPGRCAPRVKAVWSGAPLTVHRAHPSFRLIPGKLDFVEVPATSDQSRRDHWTGVGDIRFEDADADRIKKALRQEIGQQVSEKAPLNHVCLYTHNFVQYWPDSGGESRSRLGVLKETLAALPEIANDFGLSVKGATTSMVRQAFIGGERITK
jgi:hypothetical protein